MLKEAHISSVSRVYAETREQGKLEVEARFGAWDTDNTFTPDVGYRRYDRLLTYLQGLKSEYKVEELEDYNYRGGLRKTEVRVPGGSPAEIWMKKESANPHIDLKEYGVRLAFNTESTPTVDEVNALRKAVAGNHRTKKRHSFTIDNAVKIDMTKVDERTKDPKTKEDRVRSGYEVEIELLGEDYTTVWDKWIVEIWRILRDSNRLYTQSEKASLYRYINNLLKKPGPTLDTASIFKKIRTLRHGDLVWGGIVQKGEMFGVAPKLDGIRKMLVFSNMGIWLIGESADEVNYVGPHQDQKMSGYVLDVELIPPDKQRDGAKKNVQYTVVVVDVVYSSTDPTPQSRTFVERLTKIKPLTDAFKDNPTILIEVQEFHGFVDMDGFVANCTALLNRDSTHKYMSDGLVFIPFSTLYIGDCSNPNIPFTKRRLTNCLETCKWKKPKLLTIDFYIYWIVDNAEKKIELRSHQRDSPAGRVFYGTDLFPYHGEVDSEHELTKNAESGTIFEYSWDKKARRFIPVRARLDKRFANSYDVAIDNWKLIHRPITSKVLRGESFILLDNAIRRMKKLLYKSPSVGYTRKGREFVQTYSDPGTLMVIGPNPSDSIYWRYYRKFALDGSPSLELTSLLDRLQIRNKLTASREPVDVIAIVESMAPYWESESILQSLVNTIADMSKEKTKIIFMTMDGNSVFHMFGRPDKAVTSSEIEFDKGKVKLTLDRQQRKLKVSAAKRTKESYLVILNELTHRLRPYGFVTKEIHDAAKENFLTNKEKVLAKTVTFGILERSQMATPPDLGAPITPSGLPPVALPSQLLTAQSFIPTTPRALGQQAIARPTTPRVIAPQIQAVAPSDVEQLVQTLAKFNVSDKPPALANVGSGAPITQPLIPTTPPRATAPSPAFPPPLTTPFPPPIIPTGPTFPTFPPPLASPFPPTTSPTKIFSSALPFLPVSYISDSQPARGDDVAERLAYTYPFSSDSNITLKDDEGDKMFTNTHEIYRIATIGDGSCFFHSVLKGISPSYQENNNYGHRHHMTEKLRLALAEALSLTIDPADPNYDPNNPKRTYYDVIGCGNIINLRVQQGEMLLALEGELAKISDAHPDLKVPLEGVIQYIDKEGDIMALRQYLPRLANYLSNRGVKFDKSHFTGSGALYELDYSKEGIRRLLNSDEVVGDEIYCFTSKVLGVEIMVVSGTTAGLRMYQSTLGKPPAFNRVIVIMGNSSHFEVVARRLTLNTNGATRDLFQTIFSPDDPFIVNLLATP